MSEEYKFIHLHVFEPNGALFKSSRSKPAESQTIKCRNSENCQLHKAGSCAWRNTFSGYRCPYGIYNKNIGFTTRARNYGTWIRKEREKYQGVPYLNIPVKKLAIVGDYIYFPYAHANMNEKIPFLEKGGFMASGSYFLPKEHWTLPNILAIINFRPQALFGGTIHTYFSEEMPLFLSHLEEVMPEMYKGLLDYAPSLIEIFKLNAPKNYVGRTAKLKTISPCTYYTKGYEGNHQVKWVWDGSVLKTSTPSAYNATWGEVKEYASIELTITPDDNSTVVIKDNAQVNKDTVFVD